MKAFITSCLGRGGLFLLDTDQQPVIRRLSPKFYANGMCWWDEDSVAVVAGGVVYTVSTDGTILGGFKVHDGCAYHDIGFLTHLGRPLRVGLTNVIQSRIDMYDTNFNFVGQLPPLVDGAEVVNNACHWNEFEVYGGKLYGIAFTLTNQADGWRFRQKDTGVFFSQTSGGGLEILADGLHHPHSLRVYDRMALICNSIPSQLSIYDRIGNSWGRMAQLDVRTREGNKGFARGCTFVGDRTFLVGLSANRHPEACGFDYDYKITTAHVVWLDAGGGTIDSWEMPEGITEVYDILEIKDGRS